MSQQRATKMMQCGPENCPLTAWAALPAGERKTQRQALARKLHAQGFTEQQIATQFGVSQKTISLDLKGVYTQGINQSRPKGGRPMGSVKPKSKPVHHSKVIDLHDAGLPAKDIAASVGLGERMVDRVLEVERARRAGAAEPQIERSVLSKTAQEKFDIAIRAHKRKLDASFEARVLDECKRRLNDISLPQYAKELGELERSISSRKGIMDRISYRKILSCLHPDRVTDVVLKKRYEEAFRLFTEIEKRVLDEKQSPTEFRKMPRTYEDLMRMKAKVRAERQAKRRGGDVTR